VRRTTKPQLRLRTNFTEISSYFARYELKFLKYDPDFSDSAYSEILEPCDDAFVELDKTNTIISFLLDIYFSTPSVTTEAKA